jgi:hypothetical protein
LIEQINTEIIEPKLYLCRPNKTTIAHLPEVRFQINQKVYLGLINEMTFKIPLMLDEYGELVRNKHIDMIKERYLIRFEKGDYTEYYIIDKVNKAMGDSDSITVNCYGYGYSLASKLIKDYSVESYTLSQILDDMLAQTVWSIGYVDATFDLKYRALDFSGNVMDGIQQAAELFNALIIWDTVDQEINFYNPDNYGVNKGFKTKFGMLMQSLDHELNFDEFCTRLKLFGKEGISIQSVNPLGSNFIQDFSYFIYPFLKVDGVIVSHSDYLSDGLCESLIAYNSLYTTKQTEYTTLLTQMTTYRATLDTKQTELSTLTTQLYIIDDNLATANATGGSTAQILIDKANKEAQITTKKAEIATVNAQISSTQASMDTLANILKMENNFTSNQLIELNPFIIEKELSNENYTDAKTLLADGKVEFDKIRQPKIVSKVSIVDFYEILTESHNWDKLNIGDVITVQHERLGVNIQANVAEIDFDYESASIDITISNVRELLTDDQRFLKNYYKTISSSNTVNMSKPSWDAAKATADETTRFLNETWDAVKHDIVAGVNESVEISRKGVIVRDPTDPNKILIMQHGQIALSQDNGNTWSTAILPDRIVAERIAGRLIMGNKLIISDDDGTFVIQGNLLTIKDAEGDIRIKLGEYEDGKYGLMIKSKAGEIVLNEDGIVQTDTIQLADNVDSTHGLKLKFYIDDGMISVRKVMLNFTLEKFRAYSKGALSEVIPLTTTETQSFTAQSTSPEGTSGVSQTEGFYFATGGHNHGIAPGTELMISGGGAVTWVASGAHQHSFALSDHYHSFTVPTHLHDIDMPAHEHGIDYGIYEDTFATGVQIIIDGIPRGSTYYGSENNVNITEWISTVGWHTVELTSTQLGRINASLYLKTFVGF